MTYTDTTNFVLISQFEKDRSMIETRRLKNVVIFIQTLQKTVNSYHTSRGYNAKKHVTMNGKKNCQAYDIAIIFKTVNYF